MQIISEVGGKSLRLYLPHIQMNSVLGKLSIANLKQLLLPLIVVPVGKLLGI